MMPYTASCNKVLTDFECILINNNSSDESLSIAEKACRDDKRFRLVTETRQGVAYASTRGSIESNSEFIARMDADDHACPQRLEKGLNFLKTAS